MHLFGEPQKQEPPATDVPSQLARKLYQALHKSKILYRRVNLKSWAQCFKLMIEHGHYDQELVEVMDWYVNRIEEARHKIKITSAFDFAEKFDKIRFLKDMDTITISTVAELVLRDVPKFKVPINDKTLAFVAEQSVRSARIFIEAVRKVQANNTKDSIARTINHLGEVGFLNTHALVAGWLTGKLVSLVGWSEWSGDPAMCILDINSKFFNQMGRQEISEWCGTSGRWDELMELVRKEMEKI